MSLRCFSQSFFGAALVTVVAALAGAGCGGGGSDAKCDVPKLFADRCSGSICHSPGATQIDLVSPGVDTRVANARGIGCPGLLADPSSPDTSLLYQKVAGSPSCGGPMPQSGPPLTDSEVDCIGLWISGLLPPGNTGPDGGVDCPECQCFPIGKTQSCYTGPDGTDGKGTCKSGVQTCLADNTSAIWGACENEVYPRIDDCRTTNEDEDCNGSFRACGPLWSVGFGSYEMDQSTSLRSVAVDSNGNVFVLGDYVGTVSFGGDRHTAVSSMLPKADTILAKYDKDGNFLWSKSYGDTSNQWTSKLILGDKGTGGKDNIIVVLRPYGKIDLGRGELDARGQHDIVVAKFDNDGNVLWNSMFGGIDADRAERVAVDGNGDVIVTGQFTRTATFGTLTVTALGVTDPFIAKLNGQNGSVRWFIQLSGSGDNDYGWGVATDSASNVYVTGFFNDRITIGTTEHVATATVPPDPVQNTTTDIYLAKFDSNGVYQWSKSFGGPGNDAPFDLARNPATGGIAMTGYMSDTINFGRGGLTSAGSRDLFLAEFDSSGNNQFGRLYGDSQDQAEATTDTDNMWNTLAIDSSGNYYLAGFLSYTVDFGGPLPLTSAGKTDAFYVKLGATGNQIAGAAFGKTGTEAALDVALGPSGVVVVAGRFFASEMDFGASGKVKRTGTDSSDGFIVQFQP